MWAYGEGCIFGGEGDEVMVVIGSMDREFGADDEEVVVDSKEEEKVAMEEEGDTITALMKHQGVLREVAAAEAQNEEYAFPGESGDEAVDGIETMTIKFCLGLRLADVLLKGHTKIYKTTQQSNGGGSRVGW